MCFLFATTIFSIFFLPSVGYIKVSSVSPAYVSPIGGLTPTVPLDGAIWASWSPALKDGAISHKVQVIPGQRIVSALDVMSWGSMHSRRRIFPTLLDKFERRLLIKLSTESGRSQSAVIRELILQEIARRRIVREQTVRAR